MPLLSRRNFLGATLASCTGLGGMYVYGRTVEPGWLEVVRKELPLRNLPDAFAGFTIAQISDLHFGPLVSLGHIESALDEVLKFNADAIVITGDIITRVNQGEPEMIVQTLSRLRAPHGVFAILGNHDWWEGASTVTASLERAGVEVLSNRNLPIRRGGQTLHLAGIDDVWCDKHDVAAALHGIPDNAAIVALVHEPDFADTLAEDPRVILQLSGHSHGGQVRVPFLGGIYFPPFGRKYSLGQYQIRGLTLYTNRGIGVVNRPIRFACRPEVTLHTLKPAR